MPTEGDEHAYEPKLSDSQRKGLVEVFERSEEETESIPGEGMIVGGQELEDTPKRVRPKKKIRNPYGRRGKLKLKESNGYKKVTQLSKVI